jgi:serine/threonine protein kinase
MGRLGDHPNVVTVFDIEEEDGQVFLVSRYVPGGDVETRLREAQDNRLPVSEALAIAIDVAAALQHAHEQDIVHRDVKPGNVWLATDDTALLGDFGVAFKVLLFLLIVLIFRIIATLARRHVDQGFSSAASHDILERARCNSNAPEVVSPTHTPHPTARFPFIRFSRAALRATASFLVTSSPMPKNTSSGVCPLECRMGHHVEALLEGSAFSPPVVGFDVELDEPMKRREAVQRMKVEPRAF